MDALKVKWNKSAFKLFIQYEVIHRWRCRFDCPDFLIASSEWYTILKAKDYFDTPGDHADELETSVMMHYHLELVNLEEAGEGAYETLAMQSLNEKIAWIPKTLLNHIYAFQ